MGSARRTLRACYTSRLRRIAEATVLDAEVQRLLCVLHHFYPARVERGGVFVVPVPPLVGLSLGIALWRILPLLLAPEGRHVKVAPCTPHRFVATVVNEVSAENPLALSEEHVVSVPFINAEILVEAVRDGIPGHLPSHPRLQARDICLRSA